MTVDEIPDDARAILAFPFDFAVDEIPDDALLDSTRPPEKLTLIAGEGAGGVYAQIVSTGEIVFVSSEGQAAIVAPSLDAFLCLVMEHPYWRDLLKFSGGGDLEEMRRAVPWAARDYAECYPEAAEGVQILRSRLGIHWAEDMLQCLHASVASTPRRIRFYAADGGEFDSLFNQFKAP